ncbi:MAG: hypothetical protein GYA22_09950 [Bacteroidales bacterium]|nr:hypothetical protein [Bacteroidales bacterium]
MRLFIHRHLILTSFILLIPAPHPAFPEPSGSTHNPSTINFFVLSHTGLNNGNYIWTGTDDSITIPLRRAGRIFLIEAEVDGEKGYLVFDTGASGLVLNKTYFRDHVVLDNQKSNGVTGAVASVERIAVNQLEIYGLKYQGIIADVTNLGHIENRRGVKILGLIGFGLISDFEIIFNPGQNQLQLFKIDKKGERERLSAGRFIPDYTCNFEYKNNILFLRTTIKGKRLRLCFDTGAETNVIDRYAPKSVLNCIAITHRSTLSGAGSRTAEVLFGSMNGFQFGKKSLSNMETIITNLDVLSEAYDTKIDGMLGYSFLSKGIICINFVKKEFSISYLQEATEE